MKRIDREALALKNILRQAQNMNNQIKKNKRTEKVVNNKERTNKLIQAGKIFEEAGILDNYNKKDVLEILKDYGRNLQ